MRLLVLGGTLFLGRHVVEAALERGHEVTLFNRGRTNPALFSQTERITGDRDGDLSELRGEWDTVIDTSAYFPGSVGRMARHLRDRVRRYLLVSTFSVYAELGKPGLDETATLVDIEPHRDAERVTSPSYAPLKLLCEEALRAELPERSIILRPGLIFGPHDYSRRLDYWVLRIARGGHVLAPGVPDRRLQLIDARDLARWMVQLAAEQANGLYNANGPEQPLTLGTVLDTCRRVTGSDADFVWVDERFLFDRDVAPWTELPLWLPEPAAATINVERAIAAGLRFRPLEETVADTYRSLGSTRIEWPVEARWSGGMMTRVGMARDREARLLEAWWRRPTRET